MDETAGSTQDQAPAAEDPAQTSGVTLMRPVIVGALYLLNIFLGFSVFIGLVLAYIWRNDPATQEWEKTHFTYLIRTFWIGFLLIFAIFAVWLLSIIGVALDQAGQEEAPRPEMFFAIFGGFIVIFASAIWFCTRCILSLLKAGDRKPMPKPETWLF